MANTPKEPPKNFIDALNEQEAVKKQEQDKAAELQAINKAGIKNVEATNRTTDAVTKGAADIKAGVAITNPDLAKTNDVASAVDAIHKLNLTTFNTNQGLPQLADNLVKLTEAVQALQKDYESKGVAGLSKQLATLVQKLDGVSKTLSNSKVEVDSGLQKTIDNLQKSIDAIEFSPSVNVKAPAAKVVTTPVDLSSVEEGLKAVVAAVQEQESSETDLTPVINGLESVQNAITSLRFPVPNFELPFKDVNGKSVQVQLDASGNIPTSGGGSGGGAVTIADGADVTLGTKADAKSTATDTTPITIMQALKQISASVQAPPSQAVTNAGTFAVQVTTINGQAPAFGTGTRNSTTQRVTIATDDVVPASQSGTWTVQPGNTANTTPWLVSQATATPVLKNGLTNTASAVVSSVAATLTSYYIYNPNTSAAYVQILDVATAGGVTLGTTTPKWSVGIPPGSAANVANLHLSFANGIQVAATTTATGSTAPTTALDCNFAYR